jgi:hypothetical protein
MQSALPVVLGKICHSKSFYKHECFKTAPPAKRDSDLVNNVVQTDPAVRMSFETVHRGLSNMKYGKIVAILNVHQGSWILEYSHQRRAYCQCSSYNLDIDEPFPFSFSRQGVAHFQSSSAHLDFSTRGRLVVKTSGSVISFVSFWWRTTYLQYRRIWAPIFDATNHIYTAIHVLCGCVWRTHDLSSLLS